jgi:putative ABC transport system ATP-binding protein
MMKPCAIPEPPRPPAGAADGPARGGVLVRLSEVCKVFGSAENPVQALRRVTFEILQGEYLSIMGPSGSGKTTLFNMIGALDRCTSGTVEIGGVRLNGLRDGELAFFRGRHIGYVFQSYNLLASMTALANVALPAVLAGEDPRAAEERAEAMLARVGLGHRLRHRPDELSGGQQQRVAIARALVNRPTIVLADEPTGNLDLQTGEEIIALLGEFARELGVTVITATHDYKMLKASDRIVWMKDGAIDRVERAADVRIDEGGMDAAAAPAGGRA